MPERKPVLGGALLALAVLFAGASWLTAGSAGPLAWLAGPVVVLPALVLSGASQRRRARRGDHHSRAG